EQWLLVVVFDKQTHIGLVKVLARKAVEELERVLDRVKTGGRQAKEQVLNVQFRNTVDSAIDRLFQD
ncbi:MAG TPA: roadblock/LC7 domain-containing protein, partial [Ktedonobacterales bacterium]|nr:roadblock/LC7 domain-containing protein [Ktedonobacterales bacterium]